MVWFAYNAVVFGDWLDFARGPYSAAAIEIRTATPGSGPPHPGWHNPWVSLLFFKLAALPLAVLVLFLIYRYVPNGPTPPKRVVPAAISVGLLMEVLKYINTLLWPGFQRKLAREYGVFQYSVTLIFLGFLASMLVLVN